MMTEIWTIEGGQKKCLLTRGDQKKDFCTSTYSEDTDDVGGKRRYSRNILQWTKNDFKSTKSTNGDYLMIYKLQTSKIKKIWANECVLS